MTHPIISADSHVTEAPNTYLDFIDPTFRDRAPRLHSDEENGKVLSPEQRERILYRNVAELYGIEFAR